MIIDAPLMDSRRGRELHVIKALYRSHGMTRGELAELTGLGATVVVRLVGDLVERGVLTVDSKVERSSRGRPSELLRLDAAAGYVVGLEFGRDQLVAATVDALGRVVHQASTRAALPFLAEEDTVAPLADLVRAEAAAAGVPWMSVRAAGLALHDVVNAAGEWLTQDDLEGEALPIAARLQATLDMPVLAEDVSRAFALAEREHGAARDEPDAIYLFVGADGVGSGIFVNGELLRSSSGVCGEVGHLVVVASGGARCACGNRGCLETVATHHAVVARFLAIAAEGVTTSLDTRARVDFADVCAAAAAGDKAAYLALAELAGHLGRALAGVINITGATHVVVGGQLAGAGPTFLADLASELRKRVMALLARNVAVVFAALPAHAGAWGVALQALDTAIAAGHFLTVGGEAVDVLTSTNTGTEAARGR